MNVDSMRHGISAVLATLEVQHQHLTELDAKIGDGDLGITLLKAFRELGGIKDGLPDDLGQAFMQCAQSVMKVSSSSFGTLFATALIAVSKKMKGQSSVDWSILPQLLEDAEAAIAARGKANLGDKTVLDALSQAAKLSAGKSEPAAILASARQGIEEALKEFRDKPNKIGRARIFAERTIGLDDPGMVALKVMAGAL